MNNFKEMLRDEILTKMRNYLDQTESDILNQVLVEALFHVDVIASETLPATVDDSNENIINIFLCKKAQKLSEKSAEYYLNTVKHFIEFTNKSLLQVTDMDVEFYLNWYYKKGFNGTGNSTATVNNERRNLSAFFTWMRKTKMITENPVDGVEKYGEVEKPIDHMEDWEVEALRDACKEKVKNKVTHIEEYRERLRDRAMIEFLRSTAVRVGECVSVNTEDINWSNGEIVVYGHKNRTYRTVCLDDVAKFHLKKYIDSRKDDCEALFVKERGSKDRLSKSGIECAIRSIAKKSMLERRVYPHLFRKTTATNMASKGCQRELVAFYLGHKNGNTSTLNKHYAATDPRMVTEAFRRYGAAA